MSIKNNITSLRNLLERVNALPDASNIELPELSNEGSASDLINGKELIDADGNKIVGTFTIENELTAQDDLISQIQAAVDNLPEAGSSTSNIQTCLVTIGFGEPAIDGNLVYKYLDGNCTFQSVEIMNTDKTIEVLKDSIIYIKNWSERSSGYISDTMIKLFKGIDPAEMIPCAVYRVTGPGELLATF